MNQATFSVLAMRGADGLAATADAQVHHIRAVNGIDRLQHRQPMRIGQGVRNGRLTPREIRRLSSEQRSIATFERHYCADGVPTRAERHYLQGELQHASRRIYNQTHDNDGVTGGRTRLEYGA